LTQHKDAPALSGGHLKPVFCGHLPSVLTQLHVDSEVPSHWLPAAAQSRVPVRLVLPHAQAAQLAPGVSSDTKI
jgi:hypothetical protein